LVPSRYLTGGVKGPARADDDVVPAPPAGLRRSGRIVDAHDLAALALRAEDGDDV
jgi:hypothetical protein